MSLIGCFFRLLAIVFCGLILVFSLILGVDNENHLGQTIFAIMASLSIIGIFVSMPNMLE